MCSGVTLSGKKNLDDTPDVNVSTVTEVQTLTFENLKITLNNVKFPVTTGALADATLFHYLDLYTMYKHSYNGSNPYILNIKIRGHDFLGLNGVKDIKVVLEDFSLPLDATDSRDGYMITGSMSLVETK